VPYKESPFPDLIAGRVHFAVQSSAAVASLIRSGKLRGLAVLSRQRIPALPDVPTSAEAGMPDLVYNAGVCLYAPGGTPQDTVARLNRALNHALQSEPVVRRFADFAVEPVSFTPEQTSAFIGELMGQVDELRKQVFGKAR
jgi:tripartite-type tricarboxylate transporter receptor subunit TctC